MNREFRSREARPSFGVAAGVFGVHLAAAFYGLLLGVIPALVLNAWFGLGFTAPLDQGLGPAALWWMPWLAWVALTFTAYGAWTRRPVLIGAAAYEGAPTFVGCALLLWLWLHEADAFLWPSLAFTVLYVVARIARWSSTERSVPQGLEAKTAAAVLGAAPSAVPSPAEEFPAQHARTRFADVLGMQREKRLLLDFAREARSGSRNGALLFGPPGAGKTFLVEALAGELALALISVSIGRLASMWVNATTEHIAAAFSAAKRQAPCVLFFDEIDAVMVDRAAASNDAEGPRIVAALLTELVAIRGAGVLVLAATNFPERLDAAGTREGRFDLKIEIALPDARTRREILEHGIGAENAERIREGTLDMAVRHFAGFSVARLFAIAAKARAYLAADRSGKGQVHFGALLAALRSIQGLDLERRYEEVPELEDLVLAPRTREEIGRLARQMRAIEEHERSGGALPRGAVFHGPPGGGKTLTARTLAKATRWSFIPTTGFELMRDDRSMDKLLERASNERPAIVFIDEADDILAERTLSPHTRIAAGKLLALLDGAGGRIPDVFYIAATNHPGALDEAALRRFPKKIEFPLPGPREIERYLEARMQTLALPCSPALSPGAAAKILSGHSIADIDEALGEAINLALADQGKSAERHLDLRYLARAVRGLSFDRR